MDQDVAEILRASRRPVILVGNKADTGSANSHYGHELYALGLGEPMLIMVDPGNKRYRGKRIQTDTCPGIFYPPVWSFASYAADRP